MITDICNVYQAGDIHSPIFPQARAEFIKLAFTIPMDSADALQQNNELLYNLLLAPEQVTIGAQVINIELDIWLMAHERTAVG